MLRTLRRGAGATTVGLARVVSSVSVMPDHSPLSSPYVPREAAAYWIPRFRGGRRSWVRRAPGSPPQQFRLARQLHGLDLLELDRALGHEIVEIAIGRA